MRDAAVTAKGLVMDRERFDALARLLAATGSRRGAVGALVSVALLGHNPDVLADQKQGRGKGKRKARGRGRESRKPRTRAGSDLDTLDDAPSAGGGSDERTAGGQRGQASSASRGAGSRRNG